MANTTETPERTRRGPEPPDLSEKGGMKDGQPQRSNERLFMQLLAFGGCPDGVDVELWTVQGGDHTLDITPGFVPAAVDFLLAHAKP